MSDILDDIRRRVNEMTPEARAKAIAKQPTAEQRKQAKAAAKKVTDKLARERRKAEQE